MKLKWVGLAICSGILIFSWWLFSPKNRIENEPLGRQSATFEVRPLTFVKSKVAPLSQEPEEKKPSETSSHQGPLTNQEIEDVFLNHQRQFQNCWVQRLKDSPKLQGKAAFRITISPRGRVIESQLMNSTIDDTLMLQCLNSTLHRFVFREFRGDPIEVQLPLEFEF